jgi:hypothetical protein
LPHQRLWGGPRPRSATTRYGNHPALYRAGFAACRQTLSTSTRNGCSSTFAINKTSDCFLRVGCELDSWIMVGADGLGSKEDVRVFNLIVLAQFVWRVSSAAIPARRPQVVAPPDRMPRPYRAVRRTRRDVRQRVSAPMGPMVYCRRNTAGARSPRSGAPLFPRNPKAGPSFPCAWAFGDRRWRGRRQVAIGPPGLFGLVRRDDLGA